MSSVNGLSIINYILFISKCFSDFYLELYLLSERNIMTVVIFFITIEEAETYFVLSSDKSCSIRTYFNWYLKLVTGISQNRGKADISYELKNVPF